VVGETRVPVVVITGASAGVGRATALAFARGGAAIGLVARGHDGLAAARRDVESLGGQALACPADIADPAQVERAAAAVEEAFGPIDVWINNAMVSVFSPATGMSPEEFKRVTEVTYLGTVHGTLSALRRMMPRDRGVIIQVGSALAYRAIPLQSAYCAAKHAVQGFTESVRCELLHDGSQVQVCMVNLPAVNTPQFRWVKSRLPREPRPVPPIYQPEVAASAIVWVASHPVRELNVGAPTVLALLADKLAPGFADGYLAKTGYDAQQTDRPVSADRADNLWAPLPGDPGAHGDFDAAARPASLQLTTTILRHTATLAAAAILTRAIWLRSTGRVSS
jgi:NAD(P)-dependent dehydrogenase (short-subunit alcohol dehydrogenase family)